MRWLLLGTMMLVQCTMMQSGKQYPDPPVKPTVAVKRGGQGTVAITVALGGSGTDQSPSLRFVRSLKDMHLIVHIPGTSLYDTLHPLLSSSYI